MRAPVIFNLLAAFASAALPGWMAIDPVLTPYFPNGTLNTALVPTLAQNCASNGVDIVLLGGSNGEWPSLSVEERLALLDAWTAALGAMKAANSNHSRSAAAVPKLMLHAGHTDVATARLLAAAGEAKGVDSILLVAPGVIFAPATVNATVQQLASIASAAPKTPMYYYHYPKIYQVNVPLVDFVPLAVAAIPTFAGVKYIDSTFADFAPAAAAAPQLDFFPQSGFTLPSLPYGGNGAPIFTWQVAFARAVYTAWAANDVKGAATAQLRMLQLDAIMAQYGGTSAARACYKIVFGVDLGPIRSPQSDLTPGQVAAMVQQLKAGGFLPQ